MGKGTEERIVRRMIDAVEALIEGNSREFVIGGVKVTAKNMFIEWVSNKIEEGKLENEILKFSKMLEDSRFSSMSEQEASHNSSKIASRIRKEISKKRIDVIDQIRKIIEEDLINFDMEEKEKNRICDAFMVLIWRYLEDNYPDLYQYIQLQESMQSLKAELSKPYVEKDKNLEIFEHLARIGESRTSIDNIFHRRERLSEINMLREKYEEGQHVVFLHGEPGMGKTVLAKLYANQCKEKYDRTYFLSYEKSFGHTLKKLGNGRITIDVQDVMDYFYNLSESEKQRTFLIIDNFNDDGYEADNQIYADELNGEIYNNLVNSGIHLLITTRIDVGANRQRIESLEDIKELFISVCEDPKADAGDGRITKLITAVNKNTLLVTLLAHIWSQCTEEEKDEILQKLIEGRMAEDNRQIAIETGAVRQYGTETFYNQLEEIFYYGPILKSVGKKKWMACAALLPLEGMEKEAFLSAMNGMDRNELNDLIKRSWILEDGQKIFLHAGIREVTRRNSEIVIYDNCKQYCDEMGRKLDCDLEKNFHNRVVYHSYGEEIYRVFPNEKDENVLWMYYNLSDIYDQLKEKKLAKELGEKVIHNIESFGTEGVKTGRILSGIAYSLIQDAKSREELQRPHEMLDKAEDILRKIPRSERDAVYEKIRGKVLSNKGAYLQKEADILKINSGKTYEKAKKQHEKTLEYRLDMVENWEEKVPEETFQDLLSDLAISYKNVATEQFHLGEYEGAMKNHRKAIAIYKKLGRQSSWALTQKLLIGCMIQWYKKTLEFDEEMFKEVLESYPILIRTFQGNHQNLYLEECIGNFGVIEKIVGFDGRYTYYHDKVIELRDQIEQILEK